MKERRKDTAKEKAIYASSNAWTIYIYHINLEK